MSLDKASLVLIPDGAKDGKLYSVKPIDGSGDFTFSRGSNLAATRVNENGLIEKGRENLLLNSNQFDTTWNTPQTSVTSGQSGYDGSSDAWLLEADAVSSVATITQAVSMSGIMTATVYAKEGTTSWLRFSINDSGTNTRAWFNLNGSGAVGTTSGNIIDTNIESAGNGYFRCSITFDPSDATTLFIFVTNADNSTGYSVGDNIYIQDAQLERGLVATDYIESGATTGKGGLLEDLPRIDFSEGVSCPSLLLEPTRTNLVPNSEYFGAWTIARASFGANDISPSGFNNAYSIVANTTNDDHFVSQNITVTNETTYVFSAYLKKGNKNWARLWNTAVGYVDFDLQNEIVGTENSAVGSIQSVGNGWYRCSIVYTATSTADNAHRIYTLEGDNNKSFAGDNSTINLYIYGAQLEEGATATSYIPTYGSSVTRTLDRANATGTIQPYRFGSGAFSIFLEHGPIPTGSNGNVVLLGFSPLDFYFRYTTDAILNIYNQDGSGAILNQNGVDRSTNHKILMVYDGVDSTDVYIDGVKRKSGYSYTWSDGPYYPILNTSAYVSGDVPLKMNQIAIFDEALSEAKSIALTL